MIVLLPDFFLVGSPEGAVPILAGFAMFESFAPQLGQKRLPSFNSVPQLGHFILYPHVASETSGLWLELA
jgi:hypothetical protein